MTIGEIFKKYREDYNLSQVEMGALLGSNDRYISRIEKNKVNPSHKITNNLIQNFKLKKNEKEVLEMIFIKEKLKTLMEMEKELLKEKREIYMEKERIKSVTSVWTNRIEIKEKLISLNSTLQKDMSSLLMLISMADENLLIQIKNSIELTISRLSDSTKQLENVMAKKIEQKNIEVIDIIR